MFLIIYSFNCVLNDIWPGLKNNCLYFFNYFKFGFCCVFLESIVVLVRLFLFEVYYLKAKYFYKEIKKNLNSLKVDNIKTEGYSLLVTNLYV